MMIIMTMAARKTTLNSRVWDLVDGSSQGGSFEESCSYSLRVMGPEVHNHEFEKPEPRQGQRTWDETSNHNHRSPCSHHGQHPHLSKSSSFLWKTHILLKKSDIVAVCEPRSPKTAYLSVLSSVQIVLVESSRKGLRKREREEKEEEKEEEEEEAE